MSTVKAVHLSPRVSWTLDGNEEDEKKGGVGKGGEEEEGGGEGQKDNHLSVCAVL